MNNRINDTKKLRVCRRFKCLLVKVVLLARYRFVFGSLKTFRRERNVLYDVFVAKVGLVLIKTRPLTWAKISRKEIVRLY